MLIIYSLSRRDLKENLRDKKKLYNIYNDSVHHDLDPAACRSSVDTVTRRQWWSKRTEQRWTSEVKKRDSRTYWQKRKWEFEWKSRVNLDDVTVLTSRESQWAKKFRWVALRTECTTHVYVKCLSFQIKTSVVVHLALRKLFQISLSSYSSYKITKKWVVASTSPRSWFQILWTK